MSRRPRASFLAPGALFLGLWPLLLVLQLLHGPKDGYSPFFLDSPAAPYVTGLFLVRGVVSALRGILTRPQIAVLYSLTLTLLPVAGLLVIRAVRRAGRADLGRHTEPVLTTLVFGLALSQTLGLAFLSNDVLLYRAYGTMQEIHGANPCTELPVRHLPARALERVPSAAQASAYGPVALLLFRLAVRASSDPAVQVLVIKFLMALPMLAILAWIRFSTKLGPPARLSALVWLGLNPLLVFEVFQTGHLEGWILALLLLAAVLVEPAPSLRRVVLGGAVAGLACGVKLSTLVVLGPLVGAVIRSDRQRGRPLPRALLKGALPGLAAVSVVALGYAPFWEGIATFRGLESESTKIFLSVPYFLGRALGLDASAVRDVGAGFVVLAASAGLVASLRGARVESAMILSLAVQAVLGRTVFHPWYVCPLVGLVILPELRGGKPATRGARVTSRPPDAAGGTEWPILVWSVSGLVGGYAPFIASGSHSPFWQGVALAVSLIPPALALVAARGRSNGAPAP